METCSQFFSDSLNSIEHYESAKGYYYFFDSHNRFKMFPDRFTNFSEHLLIISLLFRSCFQTVIQLFRNLKIESSHPFIPVSFTLEFIHSHSF